ncbi:AGE family epimerase/isomerase [Chromohalobacter nigrandesensis]|uniref:AGE family epimerase/isomerase n=1 Tax=Chromohalobacter nigrandesensis TaxID=119863 RepID=UPI001FF52AE9|nr:AGE family epimerase/isomerase [Chromohalobacter nigrandesensis]MCK0746234.1 AGE family epimerase/isomerase [Chromohalobacter nigrandesensis]
MTENNRSLSRRWLDTDTRHWTHAEALVAAGALLQRTGEAHYEHWYRHMWDFIDRARGGWYQELDHRLVIDPAQGDVKPDLYHAYQATLLPRLPLAPALAVAVAMQDS